MAFAPIHNLASHVPLNFVPVFFSSKNFSTSNKRAKVITITVTVTKIIAQCHYPIPWCHNVYFLLYAPNFLYCLVCDLNIWDGFYPVTLLCQVRHPLRQWFHNCGLLEMIGQWFMWPPSQKDPVVCRNQHKR